MTDRKSSRTGIDHPAQICSDGASIGCSVVNISADGGAIDVPNPRDVPDRFQLVTEHGRVVINCRIVWIKRNRIGVAFE
ncbi:MULTISPECIES: PilZ domain-containing protein [unclassified Nitrobacter]|uniref:PilZ domain-containing protein n=1 Tax=unclassified Nitrobacter TaxID=2620411 RepID=UPI000A051245|nr:MULTISPECIES: PilZ domain-containing protein [unclassified Nitrobacter]MCB1393342.1 PilZ domain-containing protein [Nitrobacter sp.]MCV0385828.1 PilZ domain-containing protein [Nitrobacter sp.]